MLRSGVRFFPKLRNVLSKKNNANLKVQTPMVASRGFHNRRSDPFTQMETFMKDMERKFWDEVNHSFPRFPRLSPWSNPAQPCATPSPVHSLNQWGPSNISTSDTFKLAFNFPQAKPEDVKVTLKDRLLTVEMKVEESSATTKVNQSLSLQYTVPESVDVQLLESKISHDGVLTIQAPKTPDEAPTTININRE